MKNKDEENKKNNPFPIKETKKQKEKIAEGFLNSEYGEELKYNLDKEFLDYTLLGINPTYLDKDFITELEDYTENILELSADEVIDRYKKYLSEDDLKYIEDARRK